jgi:hemerythrin superfamily protein
MTRRQRRLSVDEAEIADHSRRDVEGEDVMAQSDQTHGDETRAEPDDAIVLLHADHRQVDALFQQYEDTPDPYLKQIIAEHVFAELTLHMLLEETVFYPALAEQADEEGKRLVSGARQDHQQLRALITALQAMDDEVAFETSFHALRDHVNGHFATEETTMFLKAQQALAAHLDEIAVLLQECKKQMLAL